MNRLYLLVLPFLAAGCGSSEPEKTVSADAIYACLMSELSPPVATVTDAKDELDFLAGAAGEKGINVDFGDGGQNTNIAVERSVADAKATLKQYEVFFKDAGKNQIVRIGPVVRVFDKTPRASESDPIDGCIRDGSPAQAPAPSEPAESTGKTPGALKTTSDPGILDGAESEISGDILALKQSDGTIIQSAETTCAPDEPLTYTCTSAARVATSEQICATLRSRWRGDLDPVTGETTFEPVGKTEGANDFEPC